MRGLWRTWVEENGADQWSARVEVRRGEWADVAQAEYEAAGYAPPFWDLPLKEDYLEAGKIEPIDIQFAKAELKVMPYFVILLIIAGGIAATLFLVSVFFRL